MPIGNRSGVKQRVLKKLVLLKKEKAFKGIPWHRKNENAEETWGGARL